MAETTVTQKDTPRQDSGLRLIVEGGSIFEKPSINQILDEIELVFMNPIRSAQHILDYGDASKKETGLAESLLCATISHWDKFARDISDCFRKPIEPAKKQSIFDDHRFWEHVAQIKIDGHNPADILETWLKEHNPQHFEDLEEATGGEV